jgi:hypothetical protein
MINHTLPGSISPDLPPLDMRWTAFETYTSFQDKLSSLASTCDRGLPWEHPFSRRMWQLGGGAFIIFHLFNYEVYRKVDQSGIEMLT